MILLSFHDMNMDVPVMLAVAQIDHVTEQNRGVLTFSVKDQTFSSPGTMRAYADALSQAARSGSPLTILEF